MKKIFLLLSILLAFTVQAKDLSGLKIYVNPGHGGYDSDDRNVAVYPYAQGDTLGFWESSSNLHKGLMLRDLLQEQGADVMMSRVLNRTEDDRGLEIIGREASEWGADMFFSIHSNALGSGSERVNYPLMLFRGYTENPIKPADKVMSKILFKHLIENEVAYWTRTEEYIAGDFDFYPDWNNAGLGVLRRLTVPGMLSEGSFHEYVPETYRLLNMDYKWMESWHFVKAVMEYFERDGFTKGNIAGAVYDSRMTRTETYKQFGRDKLVPLTKAKVTLLPNNITYTTDNLYNGVYVFKDLEPGNYQIKVEAADHYDKTVDVVVTADKITYANMPMDRIRSTPPVVTKYSPVMADDNDSINCRTPITLEFNWDMDTESVINAFSIEPPVEGDITFEDSQYRMIFTPTQPYEVATNYTVKLAKTAKHPGEISMENDFSFSFLTQGRNKLLMIAASPDGGVIHYAKPTVEFRFDHVLDAVNIRDYIKAYDKAGAEVAFNTRAVTYNKIGDEFGNFTATFSNDLKIGDDYVIKITDGLKDTEGLNAIKTIEIPFKAVDVRTNEGAVVESFEGTNLFAYNAEQSTGVKSAAAKRYTTQKLFDASSYDFTYTFEGTEGSVMYVMSAPSAVTAKGNKVIGLHVFGDLTGNEVYLQFTSGTEVQLVKIATLNFRGWQFREVKLNLDSSKDYQFTGVKLVRINHPLAATGDFCLDNMIVYDQLINSVEQTKSEGLNVFPNPASEFIKVTSESNIRALELYSIGGALIKRVNDSTLKVSDVIPGTYVLKVETDKGVDSVPVIIVR